MGKRLGYAMIIALILCGMSSVRSQARETAMTREDLNIVFVVDHSGSMNEQDAKGMIPQVLKIFTDTMHGENIRVGYLAYNDAVVVQKEPVSIQDESEREALKQTIESADNRGETDIGLGLREAYHMMDGYAGRKMVVLISDGETDLANSNTGRTEKDSEHDIEEIIELCKAEGTPIVTVAFGGAYEGEEAELKSISDRTGGESYEAKEPEELVAILYDLFHTNFSYSVREVSNSVYDGGNQWMGCGINGTLYDELTVLFFSDKEIGEAAILCGENEILPQIMGNYAVAEFSEAGEELAIAFETEQGQQMSVFLIGRRNITPVLKISGDIYKNKEIEFEIHFADGSGGFEENPSDYERLKWQAEFRSIEGEISVPVELEAVDTGLLGHVTFSSSGKYCLYLNADRNVENAYEVSEIHVLNTLPDAKSSSQVEMLTLDGEKMIDLADYFEDADSDELQYELQSLPQDVVTAGIEGHYLRITPRKRGTGDIVILVSDGEGSLMGRITVRVRSWLEVYPAVPFLIVCLILFVIFKLYRRRKKVIVVPQPAEGEKNRYYFTGKLNVYFTLLPEGVEEIPPLTFTLHPIREGKIVVGDMLKSYTELSDLLELDRMFFYPTDNRKIIFYHNSRASVMIGNSIVCRKMQYAIAYGSVIYVTSQDGACEMEIHYISTI